MCDEVLLAAGWSPSSLAKAMSPVHSDNLHTGVQLHSSNSLELSEAVNHDKLLKNAGWSMTDLLSALSPQHSGTKRPTMYRTPKSSSEKVNRPKKCIDTKSTPKTDENTVVDLTTPPILRHSAPVNHENDMDRLSSTLSQQSISGKNILPKENKLICTETTSDVVESYERYLDEPLPNGWRLYDFQKEAVKRCLRPERSILALDMGLGKTVISLVWAKILCTKYRHDNFKVVVIAPCTLIPLWTREATAMGFVCQNNDNFSRGNVCSETRPSMILYSWAKIPSVHTVLQLNSHSVNSCSKYLLICDEAHAMQSLQSQRTRASLDLCLHKLCAGLILATGTPMKNGRPVNIIPLLIGIRHPIVKNKLEFEKRYCNARKTRYCNWDTSGATHLEELQQKIGQSLIRMTKEECLKDLPPLLRARVCIELPQSVLDEYNRIISQYKADKARGSKRSSSGLEMMAELRQLTSSAKVSHVVGFVKELLNKNFSPIVIFVWFRETALKLVRKLSEESVNSSRCDANLRCAYISGDITNQQARQGIVDSFQNGNLDVVVCTFGVGSTGLTLTRSNTVVLLDRPWTPGDARQAEDRVRRIGQTASEVKSYWIAGFDIDDSLDKLLQKKNSNSDKVISGDTTSANWFQDIPPMDRQCLPDRRMNRAHFYSLNKFGNKKEDSISQCRGTQHVWCGRYDNDENTLSVESSIMKTVLREIVG